MNEAAEGGTEQPLHVRSRHIKKRALKNKSLSVSFDEKGLKDFVTGFHKRKKKRRKEALQQQEAVDRRKRIEMRKKRKLNRDFAIYGDTQPNSGTNVPQSDEELDNDEDDELHPSVSGTTMYDNGDMQITVTTSEIAREEYPVGRAEAGRPPNAEPSEKSRQASHLSKKKHAKKASKKRSNPRPRSKREKRKGKKKNERQ